MKYCVHCRASVSDVALFCPSCGVQLSQQGEAAQSNTYLNNESTQNTWQYNPNPTQPPHQTYAQNDNPPGKLTMMISIFGLILSLLLNPIFAYPVIAYGIHLSNKELNSGLTTRTTAKTICTVALIIAIVMNAISLIAMILGYRLY